MLPAATCRSGVPRQRCDRPIRCLHDPGIGGVPLSGVHRLGRQQVHRGPIVIDPVATKALLVVNVAISLVITVSGGGAPLAKPPCSTSVSPVRCSM